MSDDKPKASHRRLKSKRKPKRKPKVDLSCRRVGKGARAEVTAKVTDTLIAVDTINLADAKARAQYAKAVAKKGGSSAKPIEAELLRLAGETTAEPQTPTPEPIPADVSGVDRPELLIDYEPLTRNGMATVTARIGSDIVAAEKLDLLRVNQRSAIAERIAKASGTDVATVEKKLLEIAGEFAADSKPPPDDGDADLSRLVRPELFHTPDVSGVTVPRMSIIGGRPVGKWELYLQWHGDGRREARELSPCIDLPDGKLWLHPIPADPSPTILAGWSARGRSAWLSGELAPEPGDVFRDVCERLAYYLDFPPETAPGTTATVALWMMFTYVFPAWSAVPYLALGGPKGSGKTTLLTVLERSVFRPTVASSVSASALFRELNENGGIAMFDEAERLRADTPDNSEIRAILNAGYKRGATVRRSEPLGNGKFRVADFQVFGPKVVAAIAALPVTLEDRSIRINMFRAPRDSPKPRRRIDVDPARWSELRDSLHALALEHGPTWLEVARDGDACPASLSGREFELWQPLFALAKWLEAQGVGGLVKLLTAHAEIVTERARDDSMPEADELLLRVLAEHVVGGTHHRLKPSGLLKLAREREPALFEKWSDRGVSAALGRYGIVTHKSHGERLYGRVTVESLRRVSGTYGFELALPPDNVPHVPHVPPTGTREGLLTP